MKTIVHILLLLMLIVSCTSRTIYKKPDNLIGKQKMIDLWVDIYMANAAKSQKTIDFQKGVNYIPELMKKYGIDSAQFSESNIYYTSRIDEYEKMFLEVEKRLKELKKEYRPESELDSIIRASRERTSEDDYE